MDDLRKLQLIDLEILIEVDRICKESNINFFMIGGTLLGSIRNKGFIPWDDDIDIAMNREDYDKFLALSSNVLDSKYKIINFKTDENYHYYITRVANKKTKVVEIRNKNLNETTFASIDIFPIDGTPNNYFLRNVYYFRIMYRRALMALCYKKNIDQTRKRGFFEKLLLKIVLLLPIDKIFSPYIQKIKIDNLLKKQKVENSQNIGTIMGAYRIKEIVPKSFFGEGKLYEFEGYYFNGPEKADEYLTHMYGDYMTPPAENDRKTHYEVIDI